MNAQRKVKQALTQLILEQPFYGALALRLDVKQSSACKTFRTNGRQLEYNPTYVDTLTLDEVTGVICQEIIHVAHKHPFELTLVHDAKLANQAQDYAINPIIRESGFKLPQGGLEDSRFNGQAWQQIYRTLRDEQQQKEPDENGEDSQQGQGSEQGNSEPEPNDEPNGCGEVEAAPREEREQLVQEWDQAVLQAAKIAQAQGKLPAGMEKLLDKIKHPEIDWKAAMRKFIEQTAKHDYTWATPNRRYVSQGLYMPALRSDKLPPIVWGWDLSGSMDNPQIRSQCAGEATSIIQECRPERTYVLSFDTEVYEPVDEFEPGDTIAFNLRGGGGTDFRPVFDWIEKNEIEPACLIMFTDLYGEFPAQAPSYPVLWVSITREQAPFGETINVKFD